MKNLGIDLDRIHSLGCFENEETVLQTAEKYLEIIKRAVQDESVKLVVIDSIKALCTAKQLLDKKGEIRSLESDEQPALRAKLLESFILSFNQLNKKAILLMVNQISDQIGMSFDVDPYFKPKTPGGRFMEYACNLRIEATTRPVYSDKEHPFTKKHLLLGWEVWYRLVKNKYSKKTGNRVVMSEFIFDPPGFRRGDEVFRCADFLGLIEKKGGGNFTIKDQKIKGQENVVQLFQNDEKLRKEFEALILAKSEELFQDRLAPEEELLA